MKIENVLPVTVINPLLVQPKTYTQSMNSMTYVKHIGWLGGLWGRGGGGLAGFYI